MLSAAALAFYQVIAGGVYAGGMRRKVFGKDSEFAKSDARKELVKIHEKEAPGMKFSDTGALAGAALGVGGRRRAAAAKQRRGGAASPPARLGVPASCAVTPCRTTHTCVTAGAEGLNHNARSLTLVYTLPLLFLPHAGYPDHGNGRYSAALSYRAWLDMNNGQRAHYNLVEAAVPLMTLHLMAGVYWPVASAAIMPVYIIARHIWSTNYMSGGPEARYNSVAVLHQLAFLSWFGMTIAGGIKLTGLIKGF